jgi:hypothetical protein
VISGASATPGIQAESAPAGSADRQAMQRMEKLPGGVLNDVKGRQSESLG